MFLCAGIRKVKCSCFSHCVHGLCLLYHWALFKLDRLLAYDHSTKPMRLSTSSQLSLKILQVRIISVLRLSYWVCSVLNLVCTEFDLYWVVATPYTSTRRNFDLTGFDRFICQQIWAAQSFSRILFRFMYSPKLESKILWFAGVPYAPVNSPFNMKSTVTAANGDETTLLSPINSNIVYDVDDVSKAFFLLFLLVILGEGLSSAAITFADTAVLSYLGDDADQYYGERWSSEPVEVENTWKVPIESIILHLLPWKVSYT